VFDSDQKLRHLPFFEEVAGLEADSAEGRAAAAGLVTLRLVDAWLEGALSFKEDQWSVPHVRKAIKAMDEGSTPRAMLLLIVDALRERKPDIHTLVTPLMAYAQALEYDAEWLMAGDVYQTLLAHLHPIEDSEASIAAHLRLGSCYRSLNLGNEAVAAFSAASEIGAAVGDIVGVLRARVGEASIARIHGNLPRAEAILDETIAKAVGADLVDVRSRALNERASVAMARGNYELGIRFAYDAFGHAQSQTERDRILGDIAGAFANLGVFSAARDAYMVLSVTAQEQYVRWTSTLNLLEIASLTGDEVVFEQHRRQLRNEAMPPLLATAFELNLGQGYQRFGDSDRAKSHLSAALSLAGKHGFQQYLFLAEESLTSIDVRVQKANVGQVIPLDVRHVAAALQDLRETAGRS